MNKQQLEIQVTEQQKTIYEMEQKIFEQAKELNELSGQLEVKAKVLLSKDELIQKQGKALDEAWNKLHEDEDPSRMTISHGASLLSTIWNKIDSIDSITAKESLKRFLTILVNGAKEGIRKHQIELNENTEIVNDLIQSAKNL